MYDLITQCTEGIIGTGDGYAVASKAGMGVEGETIPMHCSGLQYRYVDMMVL